MGKSLYVRHDFLIGKFIHRSKAGLQLANQFRDLRWAVLLSQYALDPQQATTTKLHGLRVGQLIVLIAQAECETRVVVKLGRQFLATGTLYIGLCAIHLP